MKGRFCWTSLWKTHVHHPTWAVLTPVQCEHAVPLCCEAVPVVSIVRVWLSIDVGPVALVTMTPWPMVAPDWFFCRMLFCLCMSSCYISFTDYLFSPSLSARVCPSVCVRLCPCVCQFVCPVCVRVRVRFNPSCSWVGAHVFGCVCVLLSVPVFDWVCVLVCVSGCLLACVYCLSLASDVHFQWKELRING